jgi:para-nitrobenzyl esterase
MNLSKQTSWRAGALFLSGCALAWTLAFTTHAAPTPLKTTEARIANGVIQGVISADDKVRTYKGIPYAAPPVGPLRWKAPQPVANWSGVRPSSEYGARCMQGFIYSDMVFHDNGPSENCLYLNLWMPAHPATPKLPVMVWIYGGGFAAGSSSEPRQDAGNLSKQGVLVVSMNYRLGIFGFFTHPALAKESGHNSSGNYGLLDQLAALRWVHDNIAVFGGDPENVIIFGQSAGASSVSALVASPLAKGLFQRAIGESGSTLSVTRPLPTLKESEKVHGEFARAALGTDSLPALRDKSAEEILQAALKNKDIRFSPDIDGYFLPESPYAIYASGKQAHVPLLAGWTADERSGRDILGDKEPTPANFNAAVRALYKDHAGAVLKLYPAATNQQAKQAAHDLARDRAAGYSVWKWLELQRRTGNATVFRYEFDQAPPLAPDAAPGAKPTAFHASEIEYVFSVLGHKTRPWRPEDRKLSAMMSTYWANFAKTGNPNGADLPNWPRYSEADGFEVMHLVADPKAAPDQYRARYELLDKLGPYK